MTLKKLTQNCRILYELLVSHIPTYARLQIVGDVRKLMGIPSPNDGRIREEAGAAGGLWWLIRLYAGQPSETVRFRYRVFLLSRKYPQPHERWTNNRLEALAWVVLMFASPHWVLMEDEDATPWQLMSALPIDEIEEVAARCWPNDLGLGKALYVRTGVLARKP